MTQAPGTQIVVSHTAAIEPQSMKELHALAACVATASLGTRLTTEQALVLMMTGRDLGLSYAQSMRAFHIVNGKPVLSADAMVAVCLQSGKCVSFRTVESTSERCTVEATRAGQEPSTMTFSMEDAKRAGLLSNPTWAKYPAQMLRARAKSALARDLFPDVLLGLYDPDEVEAVPSPRETSDARRIVDVELEPQGVEPEEINRAQEACLAQIARLPVERQPRAKEALVSCGDSLRKITGLTLRVEAEVNKIAVEKEENR